MKKYYKIYQCVEQDEDGIILDDDLRILSDINSDLTNKNSLTKWFKTAYADIPEFEKDVTEDNIKNVMNKVSESVQQSHKQQYIFCAAFVSLKNAKEWQIWYEATHSNTSKIEYGVISEEEIKDAWDNEHFVSDSLEAYNLIHSRFEEYYRMSEETDNFCN